MSNCEQSILIDWIHSSTNSKCHTDKNLISSIQLLVRQCVKNLWIFPSSFFLVAIWWHKWAKVGDPLEKAVNLYGINHLVNMLPFETPTIFEQLPRFIFKMPRVVQDQKHKFETDEMFRRLSRESEVSYHDKTPNLAACWQIFVTFKKSILASFN